MDMETGDGNFWLSSNSADTTRASMPPNMTLTENSSYTFASTTSFCLDFYFEVMQNTDPSHIVTMLDAAWKENSSLALKLMFQLRDVRRGKSAKVEFYHCLTWLMRNHPQTLMKNLEHLPLHGYWKDLLFLLQFALYGNMEMITKKQVSQSKRDDELDLANVTLEDVIRKRVDGEISKAAWKAYLERLSDPNVQEAAKELFQKLAAEIHSQRHLEAKARRSAKKHNVALRLSSAMKDETFAQLYKAVERIFVRALVHDVGVLEKNEKLDSTALAGKWAPSVGGSFDASTHLGKSIARALLATVREKGVGETEQQYDKEAFSLYRIKYLVPLREAIDIVERHMSKRKWSEINYERVPSVAMKRLKKIFLARDAKHFTEFLQAVKMGEKKIASGALLPHEIVNEFIENDHVELELEEVAELQWQSYVDNLKKVGTFESALSVCDVSGSMEGDPMDAAIALSLLIAALSKPPFNGLICSFSANPQLHEVNQPTLKEKVQFLQRIDAGLNTNFQATFNLILNKAIAAKLPPNEMVKTLFVFSDMEFDEADGGGKYETDYMMIQRKFAESGYPMPGIVFWDLRGGSRSKPVTKNEKNVAMVSGFSGQMVRTFLENGEFKSPYETMLNTLGTHYDHLEVVD